MSAITIPLTEERLARLKDLAAQSGQSPEEFLRECLDRWLAKAEDDFAEAARYVLRKNAELYRRLA